MVVLDRVTPESWGTLVGHARRASVVLSDDMAGAPLFREIYGNPGEALHLDGPARYFVVSGCVQVVPLDPSARDFILQFGIPTWWVADERAVLARTRPQWGVVALRPSRVLALTPEAQEEGLVRWPEFGRYLLWVYEHSFAAWQRRVWLAETQTAQARYDLLVETQPDFVQLVPQHRLAAYLGVSPEHLSRIRRRRVRT